MELILFLFALIVREALIAPHNPHIYTRVYAPKPTKSHWKRVALRMRRVFRRKV